MTPETWARTCTLFEAAARRPLPHLARAEGRLAAGDEELGNRPTACALDLTVEVDEGPAQPLRNIGAEP